MSGIELWRFVGAILAVLQAGAVTAQPPAPKLEPKPAIYVVGATARSRLEVEPKRLPTVLEVITRAGGSKRADLTRVTVVLPPARPIVSKAPKGGAKSDTTLMLTIDVRAMIRTGNTKFNVQLEPGSLVFLPKKNWFGRPKPVDRFDVFRAALGGKPDTALVDHVWRAAGAATRNKSVTIRTKASLFYLDCNPHAPTRQQHVLALGAIGEEAVPLITAALRRRGSAKRDLLVALGMLGERARSAIEDVEALAKRGPIKIRSLAAATAKQIRGR